MEQTDRKVVVIGAGAWGTTLARHLALKGLPVRLWAYEREVVESIQRRHENSQFLPGISLPVSLTATGSLTEAIEPVALIIFAVPSHAAHLGPHQWASPCTSPIYWLSSLLHR